VVRSWLVAGAQFPDLPHRSSIDRTPLRKGAVNEVFTKIQY
jgi:hypothetical protein